MINRVFIDKFFVSTVLNSRQIRRALRLLPQEEIVDFSIFNNTLTVKTLDRIKLKQAKNKKVVLNNPISRSAKTFETGRIVTISTTFLISTLDSGVELKSKMAIVPANTIWSIAQAGRSITVVCITPEEKRAKELQVKQRTNALQNLIQQNTNTNIANQGLSIR
jgi:hypothetical protein